MMDGFGQFLDLCITFFLPFQQMFNFRSLGPLSKLQIFDIVIKGNKFGLWFD